MQYDESHLLTPEAETEAEPPVRRGHAVIAWGAILAMVGFVTFLQNGGRQEPHPLEEAGPPPQDVIVLLQSRYLVGTAELMPAHKSLVYQQASMLNQGTVEQRLRFAVLTEELAGPEKSLTALHQLDANLKLHGVKLDEQQTQLRNALTDLMTDYADGEWNAPSVDQEQRELLKSDLGWFGSLALAPQDGPDQQARAAVMRSAKRTAISLMGTAGFFCLLLLIGVIALFVFALAALTGRVHTAISCGRSRHAGIYPETFAVWLLLFFLLTQGTSWLVQDERFRTLALAMAMLASLSALVWPRLRGIPWTEIRRDIGWTTGPRPLTLPLYGMGSYAMTVPILVVGFLMTLMLMVLAGMTEPMVAGADEFSPPGVPSHPIVSTVAAADWFVALQLYLVAAVAAPIVEETMFRGVMYRHLRECSHRWGFAASFLFAALVNSFIFAVIHPQGLLAVPALMAIALGLTLAREWRGSLLPSMIAHGIHNGLLVTMLLLAIGN